jgi:hypothetical protein
MSIPRALFWSGLCLLVALWLGSVGVAFSRGGSLYSESESERGSGHSPAAVRELDSFRRISSHGSVDVEVSIGEPQRVEVVGGRDVQRHVETVVRDGTLEISTTGFFWSADSTKVRVVVPAIDALTLNGSGDATLSGVDSADLAVETYGSGDVTVSGKTGRLKYSSMGSGDGDLKELHAGNAVVSLHGSGDADVDASESLEAEIYGSGDLTYHGSPSHVSQSVHGSGEVKQDS